MINIMFGGNYKVFDGMLLCLMSAVKHTKESLNVFVLTADVSELNPEYRPISEEDRKFLDDYLKGHNPDCQVNLIKLGKEFNDWVISSKNKLSVYTPFAFLRLFSDRLDEIPDKIIYMDTDMMVNGDLKELFDTDIQGYELGVVLDRYGRFFINRKYFNSGMLLINKPEIVASQLFERVKEMCLTKKFAFPDQSALNKCIKKPLYLPRKFNEQGNLKKDTVIQHFSKRIKWLPFFRTQNVKPWQIEDVHKVYKWHQYDDIYEEYARLKAQRK